MTTEATTVVHALRFEKETRPLQPDAEGWKRWQATVRARTTCRCGLDTGWLRTAEAVRVGKEHQAVISCTDRSAP